MIKNNKINPIEGISRILSSNGYGENLIVEHITYDEKVNEQYDYQIIRESSHDGTLIFTMMNIDEALLRLINKETHCKNKITDEELNKLKDIKYRIGDIHITNEYGIFEVKAGAIHGKKETIAIPVVCEYIF